MNRRLSTRWTMYFKYILPIVWLGIFGLNSVAMLFGLFNGPGGNPPQEVGWIFLAATVVGLVVFAATIIRLKWVWLDEETLRMSNGFSEETVSLADADEVREWRWLSPRTAVIHFRQPTRFGKSVLFMPRIRFVWGWGEHPVVIELREAIAKSSASND